ncbi:hypothetical protein DRW03_25660 [Corallococcus sp. H22C18031201]|nr:hypothetical protein DRW03_25660 [Corallococcus sp. H22C18031201]
MARAEYREAKQAAMDALGAREALAVVEKLLAAEPEDSADEPNTWDADAHPAASFSFGRVLATPGRRANPGARKEAR